MGIGRELLELVLEKTYYQYKRKQFREYLAGLSAEEKWSWEKRDSPVTKIDYKKLTKTLREKAGLSNEDTHNIIVYLTLALNNVVKESTPLQSESFPFPYGDEVTHESIVGLIIDSTGLG